MPRNPAHEPPADPLISGRLFGALLILAAGAVYALLLAAVVVVGVRAAAWMLDTVPQGPLGARHSASGAHTERTTLQSAKSTLPFKDYILNAADMVASVVLLPDPPVPGNQRKDLVPAALSKASAFQVRQIDAATPFEYSAAPECGGNRGGALLVHGLTDTPFLMREVAARLTRAPSCLHVRGLLLPGHGTRPGDLLDVEWGHWRDAVAYGISSFRGTARELYLVGFSTGGALALYHALHQDRLPVLSGKEVALKGLILLSPAIEVKSMWAPLAALHKIYSWIPIWRNGKWDDLANDLDYAKYESFAKNAGWQIYLLTRELENAAGKRQLAVPALVAVGAGDTTIETCGTLRFFSQRIKADGSKLILYREPGARDENMKSCSDLIREAGEKVLVREIRGGQVLDMAHISVPTSPENPHYGRIGDHAVCVHYDNGHPKKSNAAKYAVCRASAASGIPSTSPLNVWYGELTDENLGKGVLRRLSYNPRFEELAGEIQQFVARTRGR